MEKTFKIYPALFILSPNKADEVNAEKKVRAKMNHDSRDGYFKKGAPQVYYRECQFNADRTLISIRFNPASVPCTSVMELPEKLFFKIEPRQYRGAQYTLTYIAVNN